MAVASDCQAYDVIVVGSGAAGLAAALAAARRGLSVLVIDGADHFGGAAADSPGTLWLPGNQVLRTATGEPRELAARYLAQLTDPGPENRGSRQRHRAFLDHAPEVLDLLTRHTPLRFVWTPGEADSYPEAEGGAAWGRCVEPAPLDAGVLGQELTRLRPPTHPPPYDLPVTQDDRRWLRLVARHPMGVVRLCEVTVRHVAARLAGRRLLTGGQALAAGLRAGLLDTDARIWLNTPLTELRSDGDRVTGVVVARDDDPVALTARHGVLLASGGFERNPKLRQALHRHPSAAEWSVGPAENTGDGILAALRLGAAVDHTDEAWWAPVIPLPDRPRLCRAELALPGGLLVDADGRRFGNEAAPPGDVVRAMYGPPATPEVSGPAAGPARHLPAWLIIDERHRSRYPFAGLRPRRPFPSQWHTHGVVRRASTLLELAHRIGAPGDALCATVDRFNGFARTGFDADFGRGGSAYDRCHGDPWNRPNPCLGRISRGPFYAIRLAPGDYGGKGGLRVDAESRVLRRDGAPIPGLYAAGGAAAAVTGRADPGPGAALACAMTFGYVAARHLASPAPAETAAVP